MERAKQSLDVPIFPGSFIPEVIINTVAVQNLAKPKEAIVSSQKYF